VLGEKLKIFRWFSKLFKNKKLSEEPFDQIIVTLKRNLNFLLEKSSFFASKKI
jgi:hypothetical protein